MARNKVFFHGIGTGIGDLMRQCDGAKIPIVTKSISNEGWAVEAAGIKKASGVPHVIIYRDPNPGGAASDEPDYTLGPEAAAIKHWNLVKSVLPQGVKDNKEHIWIEPVNEIDTNSKASWLGQFCYYMANLMNKDGYKAALAGFNAGQPEPSHWEAHFVDFLKYAAANQDKCILTFHEGFFFGNYETDPPDNAKDFPWTIGRFEFMHKACDALKIARPKFVLSEWAWKYNNMPSDDNKTKRDITWLASYLATFPNALGACLWNLNPAPQWGSLPGKLAKFIPWVRDFTLTTTFPDPITPVPPPPGGYKAVVVKLPQESSKNEWQAAAAYAYDFRHTITASDDDMMVVLRNGNTESLAKVAWPTRPSQLASISLLESSGFKWEPLFAPPLPAVPPPLKGVILGPAFRVPWIVTSRFNAPRDYGNGRHEGIDLDLPNNIGDSKEPILSVFNGLVVYASYAGRYGWHVIVQHDAGGGPFRTWYCHLDKVFVKPGEYIDKGRPVGELGDTGGNWGEHLHFNLQVPNYGLRGYVVDWVIDPEPYLPKSLPSPPPPPVPLPNGNIDLMSFMKADPYAWRAVKHPAGNIEDFRDYDYGDGRWAMVKNNKAEFWRTDGTYIYLEKDTSPAPAPSDGTERFYTVRPGRWALNKMSAGQVFNDGGHVVQFYNIITCAPHPDNSGSAANKTTVLALKKPHTFNTYGQNMTLDEVLFIQGNTETQIFARHQGKSLGRVAWSSPWGNSEIVALYWDRGKLERPPFNPCL